MVLKSTLHTLNFRGLIYLVPVLVLLTLSGVRLTRRWFDHFSTVSCSFAAFLLTMTLFAAVEERNVSSWLVGLGILCRSPLVADGVHVVDHIDRGCRCSTLEESLYGVLHEYQIGVLLAGQKEVLDISWQVAEENTHRCGVHINVAATVDCVTGEGLFFRWSESGDARHSGSGIKQVVVVMNVRGQNFIKFNHIFSKSEVMISYIGFFMCIKDFRPNFTSSVWENFVSRKAKKFLFKNGPSRVSQGTDFNPVPLFC
jgi:hypothetical protein